MDDFPKENPQRKKELRLDSLTLSRLRTICQSVFRINDELKSANFHSI